MPLLSSGDTAVLNARFSRVLRIGLLVAAAASVVWTTVSIVEDRREVQSGVESNSQLFAALLRMYTDQVLDQAAFSVRGVAADLSAYTAAAQRGSDAPIPAATAVAALRGAIRFDPVSAVLFVRQHGVVQMVGRDREPPSLLVRRIQRLPGPALRHAIDLLAPLEGDAGMFYVPVVAPGPVGSAVDLVGALVPIAALKEYGAQAGAPPDSGDALLLLDGTLLTRSVDEDVVRGKRTSESLQVAHQAVARPRAVIESMHLYGGPMLVAYQRSERYPIISARAQSIPAYLAPWVQRSTTKAAMLTAALLAIGWFARSLFRMNASVVASQATYRQLFNDISDGVLLTRGAGIVAGINPAALRMFGLAHEREALGRDVRSFYRLAEGSPLVERPFVRALAGERLHFPMTLLVPRTSQQIDADVHLSMTEVGGRRMLLYILRDVSAERRHTRQQEHMASHDALTGLPNRHNLLRTLDRHIAAQPDTPVHLVLVNLLRFREINESFGPRAGDTVLEVCAQRLNLALEPLRWSLFRFNGTEFMAMGVGERPEAELQCLRERIMGVLVEPVPVSGARVGLEARLGATRFPDDALDASQLLRCAEVAALQARQSLDHWVRYARNLDRSPGHDLHLRTELASAIREGQLRLFYQPKLWLEDRVVAGAEALLRWEHPVRGWIAPGEFIPLAESTDLIHPLTRWVLAAAVEQIHAWSEAGRPLVVAVNISANNLRDPDFTDHVRALLARRAIAPELLELEITEGALAHNPEIVLRRLQELRDMGLALALDDFGTGFSSLAYVRQFPFTSIKIDRSFVDAMLSSPRDRQVTKSTIALGRELGLRTIAEGLENDETAAELLALDCDIGQGYLFGRPIPVPEFDLWRSAYEARLVQAGSVARSGYSAPL